MADTKSVQILCRRRAVAAGSVKQLSPYSGRGVQVAISAKIIAIKISNAEKHKEKKHNRNCIAEHLLIARGKLSSDSVE